MEASGAIASLAVAIVVAVKNKAQQGPWAF